MLKAILSGKSGRIPEGVTAGSSWAHALKHSEDLLTSTIFERLAYLEPTLIWSLLRDTFGSLLPEFRIGELLNVEFWPTWPDPTTGGTVEPDIFLEFSLGDPARRIAVICEAKLGQQQYALQWQRQWIAYNQQIEVGEASSDEVFFLAIGGISGHASLMVERFHKDISTDTSGTVSINAAAADWGRLADAVDKSKVTASGASARILSDIAEALALFGYRRFQSLESLIFSQKMLDASAATRKLSMLDYKNV